VKKRGVEFSRPEIEKKNLTTTTGRRRGVGGRTMGGTVNNLNSTEAYSRVKKGEVVPGARSMGPKAGGVY